MAMTNSERQRRWLEKNRALHNFRRRKKSSGWATDEIERTPEYAPPSRPSTIEELQKLVDETEKAPPLTLGNPAVYRDDFGRVVTEKQFWAIQDRKNKAKDGGYEIDEYSQ